MQNPAVQVTVNHLLNIRTVETILPLKPVLIDLLERFKMVLNALVIWSALGIALPINGCRDEYRHLSQILPKALFHRNTHAKMTERKMIPKNYHLLDDDHRQDTICLLSCINPLGFSR
jgi:hypothetical protein